VSGTESRYHQTVRGSVQSFQYRGEGRSAEWQLGRMLYRDSSHKLRITGKAWSRSSRNMVVDQVLTQQSRQTGGWGLELRHRALLDQATVEGSLGYRRGTGAFNASKNTDLLTGRDTSRLKIVHADAHLIRPFKHGNHAFRYQGQVRAQWNRSVLSPGDRFALGSRYTVRGFDGESQMAGERGWLIRQDLSMTLGVASHEMYLGLDHGRIGGATGAPEMGKSLSGVALGWRGLVAGVGYDLFISWPLQQQSGQQQPGSVAGFSLNGRFGAERLLRRSADAHNRNWDHEQAMSSNRIQCSARCLHGSR